jgi:hypothetical protein
MAHTLVKKLRQRQVHLDTHTSALIPQVGDKFNADEFGDTVKSAHIDSITIFGVCHHGMAYYPSKVQKQHPGLKFDMLGEQIESLHKRGIRCPVYITVSWNLYQCGLHPEWMTVDKDGNAFQGNAPGFYNSLQFLNNGYEQLLQATTEEILKRYDVDGLFYDIVFMRGENGGPYDDVSRAIRKKFGWMEPTEENWMKFDLYVRSEFARRMNKLIRSYKKDCTIFYNEVHQFNLDHQWGLRREKEYQTHIEMESLPSGAWGYYHFPMMARQVQALDVQGLGMTGKFQKSWGDFGGRKPVPALEYECFRSQAMGFGNSVGDQLHPSGKLCKSTYQLIGQVYSQTEWAEPFYAGARPFKQIGVLSPSNFKTSREIGCTSIEGVAVLLDSLHYEYQVIDDQVKLDDYALIILPDSVVMDEAMAKKLEAYHKKGGKIIVSGTSGFSVDGKWMLDFLGYKNVGQEPLFPTFLRYPNDLCPEREPSDEVMYEQGSQLESNKGLPVWIKRVVPFFNRTAAHFSSHFHTPPEKVSKYPAALANDRTIVFADPIFLSLRRNGNEIYRIILQKAIEKLIGPPMFGYELPMSVFQSVLRRGKDAVVSLLHYIPVRKCTSIDIIDQRHPLTGLTWKIVSEKKPQIEVFGSGEELPVEKVEDVWETTLPQAQGRLLLTVKNIF